MGLTLARKGLMEEGCSEEVVLNWILHNEYSSSERHGVPVGKHVQNPKG